ncbi:MAG: HAMP domain-containing sensor histidine kinase [Balneolales bacterium]
MSFSSTKIKITLVVFLIITAGGSVIYTQFLIDSIREKERSSVELWAKAMNYISIPHYSETREDIEAIGTEIERNPNISRAQKLRWSRILNRAESDLGNSALDFVASELIIKNRFEIPSIVVDEEQKILHHRNADNREMNASLIAEFRDLNFPIYITVGTQNFSEQHRIYYGESSTIRSLRYFPYIQFGLLAVFLGIGYLSLSSIKRTEQSSLWVGMAKEAAHQLGTPLSSLYGWVELLKDQTNDDASLNIIHELKNDLQRVESVAERFNQIGSEPKLKVQRIATVIDEVSDYLERRLPQLGKNVSFKVNNQSDVRAELNSVLFAWSIENLIKNAMDAMETNQESSMVSIESRQIEDLAIIDISDTGRGMEKKYFNEVFNPGFSTKKRGWGLGLSLTKRIVEEYHNGKVYILKSAPGKGTTFRIELPVSH